MNHRKGRQIFCLPFFYWYDIIISACVEQVFVYCRLKMEILRTILTVVYILICIALVIVVLMQEGKSAGLGAISGAAETYWGKNKGRSMEGALVKITTGLAVGFMVLAVVLNLNF